MLLTYSSYLKLITHCIYNNSTLILAKQFIQRAATQKTALVFQFDSEGGLMVYLELLPMGPWFKSYLAGTAFKVVWVSHSLNSLAESALGASRDSQGSLNMHMLLVGWVCFQLVIPTHLKIKYKQKKPTKTTQRKNLVMSGGTTTLPKGYEQSLSSPRLEGFQRSHWKRAAS